MVYSKPKHQNTDRQKVSIVNLKNTTQISPEQLSPAPPSFCNNIWFHQNHLQLWKLLKVMTWQEEMAYSPGWGSRSTHRLLKTHTVPSLWTPQCLIHSLNATSALGIHNGMCRGSLPVQRPLVMIHTFLYAKKTSTKRWTFVYIDTQIV